MKTVAITIQPARAADAAAIAALLREAELPGDDLAAHLRHFVVARDEAGNVIGAVGAEVHAPDALLRSFVVASAHRGGGVGARLLAALEAAAEGWGVQRWWLLTTTAEAYFKARGFDVVRRSSAPMAIRQTGQFNGGCATTRRPTTSRRRRC